MADVFISYKSEDRDWAERVDALIRSAGYTTWWDPSLQTGERYNDRIDAELRCAKAVVVIWSARSWASTWVKEEALFARDREKLLPTRIDAVEIGVPFYSLQTVDLREWNGDPASPLALRLVESLARQVPKRLRENYEINVYWTPFDSVFAPNKSKLLRFLERLVAFCSSIGINLKLIEAWDHMVNPHTIKDRSVYERDLNIFIFFGGISEISGFAEDVFCPGLRHLAAQLNPYILHVGNEDFNLSYLNFYCMPQRKVEIRGVTLPEPDTVLGDSAIEALACFIAFHVLQVRKVVGPLHSS